ncbi:PA-phosphatase like phosphoesterase [Planoprotostelium fungivorum]|uniref:PA-phosphatase like phosphoesterase n=1 Tax=Planoprotostelium fungivorum TaxID=1890364 RepID=A0A2P6NJ06_9EUKA|nr:PA-phosphatase like phosphoesterase [Planoprotostelium fungivorum]
MGVRWLVFTYTQTTVVRGSQNKKIRDRSGIPSLRTTADGTSLFIASTKASRLNIPHEHTNITDMPLNNCTRGVGFPELLHLTVPYDMNLLQAMGVFFSMLPVALMIFFFFTFVFTRRFSFIILFSLGCLASAVNQFILKPMKEQARPAESCLRDTDGFPSGHSVNAMGVWAFLFLQEAFNYRASILRRIVLCIIYTSVFILNGPARDWVKDHTWTQIGVGMGAGAVWGTLVWLFFRFIFQRWLLEKLMASRFARWIGLVNDLDPEYRHSKYNGSKVGHSVDKIPNDKEGLLTSSVVDGRIRSRLFVAHLFSAFVHVLLGVFALPMQLYPDICSRALPGLLISIGSYTIGIGACQFVVAYLTHRKLTGKPWYPLLLKSAMMLAGTLFFEGVFYLYLIVDSSRKDGCNTQHLDRATLYAILWAAVEAVLVVFWLVLCKVYRVPTLYSNKRNLPAKYYRSINHNAGYASI